MNSAYIVAAVRTPGGRKGGRLAGWHPVDLGAYVLNTLVERAGADPGVVEDVIFGCVGQAGEQSTNIARNVVLASKLPQDVPGTSVDRQCGSSQQALQFAAQAVMSATMDIVVAGGVESMTRVPMGLPHSLPEQHGFGSYMSSGIDQRFPGGIFNQFAGAERLAEKYDLSKDELDEFALRSHRLAAEASGTAAFTSELVPVPISAADGTAQWHSRDEGIRLDASLASIRAVKLLQPGGRLTAATSSQMCDGASAILVANEKGLKALGVDPLARIHHFSVLGHDPRIMLEAPIPATERALARSGLKIDDIDLFEVNEAFASVPLSWLKATGADPERMNVLGGAIALGHPLGATGTRLMSTLVHALRRQSKRYGLQTMCEGGGMANVMIVERM